MKQSLYTFGVLLCLVVSLSFTKDSFASESKKIELDITSELAIEIDVDFWIVANEKVLEVHRKANEPSVIIFHPFSKGDTLVHLFSNGERIATYWIEVVLPESLVRQVFDPAKINAKNYFNYVGNVLLVPNNNQVRLNSFGQQFELSYQLLDHNFLFKEFVQYFDGSGWQHSLGRLSYKYKTKFLFEVGDISPDYDLWLNGRSLRRGGQTKLRLGRWEVVAAAGLKASTDQLIDASEIHMGLTLKMLLGQYSYWLGGIARSDEGQPLGFTDVYLGSLRQYVHLAGGVSPVGFGARGKVSNSGQRLEVSAEGYHASANYPSIARGDSLSRTSASSYARFLWRYNLSSLISGSWFYYDQKSRVILTTSHTYESFWEGYFRLFYQYYVVNESTTFKPWTGTLSYNSSNPISHWARLSLSQREANSLTLLSDLGIAYSLFEEFIQLEHNVSYSDILGTLENRIEVGSGIQFLFRSVELKLNAAYSAYRDIFNEYDQFINFFGRIDVFPFQYHHFVIGGFLNRELVTQTYSWRVNAQYQFKFFYSAFTGENLRRFRSKSIVGSVFNDVDSDGIYNPDLDFPYAGAQITVDEDAETITDKDGNYLFKRVKPGSHKVGVNIDSLPQPFRLTTENPKEITMIGGKQYIDFGFTQASTFFFRIVNDSNLDGVPDTKEPGLPLARVKITMGDQQRLYKTTPDGSLLLQNIPYASAVLEIDTDSIPNGYTLNQSTYTIEFVPLQTTILQIPVTAARGLKLHIFKDQNKNDLYDEGEANLGGYQIVINNDLSSRKTIGDSGKLFLRNIPAGMNTIQILRGDTLIHTRQVRIAPEPGISSVEIGL